MVTTKVYIVYYSMYGHVETLAKEILHGANSIEGVEATLWQVLETLSVEVLGKMNAPSKSDIPILDAQALLDADGFLFGFPTRYGLMAAQFKSFFDATSSLWRNQALASKPAGVFCSTGTQGGGQETTMLTTITQIVHHGMLYVPIGYTFGVGMFEQSVPKGGCPYGAGTFAGDGTQQPSKLELDQAFHQGKLIAGIAKQLKLGKEVETRELASVIETSELSIATETSELSIATETSELTIATSNKLKLGKEAKTRRSWNCLNCLQPKVIS